MGAEHFRELARVREPADPRRGVARLDGEHLALREWTVEPGEPIDTPLDAYAECFVVPREGALALQVDGAAQSLAPGHLAYLPAPAGARVQGAACRFLVVGWSRGAHPGSLPQGEGVSPVQGESPLSPWERAGGEGAPQVYRFVEALEPSAPGWRFFSVDGRYMTVGCSYREAPPPSRERPHSHDGEQINVPLEGRFAFTVDGHTETIAPGWAALTPRGVLHTGLHVESPYFQLIFATPPRGREYAEFLRSIYGL
jgi:quercetin dioxygenase-like cupin family protein